MKVYSVLVCLFASVMFYFLLVPVAYAQDHLMRFVVPESGNWKPKETVTPSERMHIPARMPKATAASTSPLEVLPSNNPDTMACPAVMFTCPDGSSVPRSVTANCQGVCPATTRNRPDVEQILARRGVLQEPTVLSDLPKLARGVLEGDGNSQLGGVPRIVLPPTKIIDNRADNRVIDRSVKIDATGAVIGRDIIAITGNTDSRQDNRIDNSIKNTNLNKGTGLSTFGSIDPATGMPISGQMFQQGQLSAGTAGSPRDPVADAKAVNDAARQGAKEDKRRSGLGAIAGTLAGSLVGLPVLGGLLGGLF